MQFAPLVVLPLLLLKLLDFVRYAKAGDVNGIVTQALAWVGGVLLMLLLARTGFADQMPMGGYLLSKSGFWDQVYLGLAVGSTGSAIKDYFKARDNSNSAAIPTLLPAGPRNTTPNKGGVAASDVG
jgi:hypothetical protein